MCSDAKVRLSGIAVHNDFGYSIMIEKVMKNIYNKISDNKVFNNIDSKGLYSCREEIAKHVGGGKYNIKCSPENILITANPMEAVSLVLHSLAKFGMKYYQECPCILNSCTFAHTYGLNLENIPLLNDGLDVNYFLKALHKNKNNQGILYLSPVNQYPTGFSTSKYKRDTILSACIKNNVAIIENDMLRDFHITKKHPKPLKSFDKQGQVIYIGSFLNAWTNIGVGYIIAEPIVIRKLYDIKAQHTIITSTLNQMIVEEMLKSGAYYEYLKNSRQIFKERLYVFNMLLEKYFSGIAEWNNNPNIFFQYLKFKNPVNTF
ncbi:MAG: PLP-dependent aminotransferase family protein, partial [Mucispirillum sp.]|nr:PLP-dependent aminotransferase family protein [Mucispirillum sp.]